MMEFVIRFMMLFRRKNEQQRIAQKINHAQRDLRDALIMMREQGEYEVQCETLAAAIREVGRIQYHQNMGQG